mgnify:CR=1 FL=1
MRQIAAAKFKEQCLALLEDVDPEGIVITKHGKPYAALVPLEMVPAPILRVQDLAGSGQDVYDAGHVQRLRDEWG